MVSHDLRALLGGIALRAGVLARLPAAEDPAGKAGRNAEIIQRFSARMNRLIGDLLDVASIEAGKLSIAPDRHDAVRLRHHLRGRRRSRSGFAQPVELKRTSMKRILLIAGSVFALNGAIVNGAVAADAAPKTEAKPTVAAR